MLSIKNSLLFATINPVGAELSALNAVNNSNRFLWDADPDIWGSHAPNLFPVIGALKNDSYIYEGQLFPMTKHGFVRRNKAIVTKQITETQVAFELKTNTSLYEMYPFLFEFEIAFELEDNQLHVRHFIRNTDSKPIYFSLGGHPAFKCPLHSNETYTDYHLKFEKAETSQSYELNMETGLVTPKTKPVFDDPQTIMLHEDLFSKDALIFKDLKSRKVTLEHKNKEPVLQVHFKDFPFLGIWAKPNAPYVCIEPWLGIADSECTNQQITEKEGIIKLGTKTTFTASYTIEIDQRHLV